MRNRWPSTLFLILVTLLPGVPIVSAQTADQAWLKYELKGRIRSFFPTAVRALGHNPVEKSAAAELNRNLGPLAGKDASKMTTRVKEISSGQTVLGTVEEVHQSFPNIPVPKDLGPEDYWIWSNFEPAEKQLLVIAGGSPKGVLYGAFELLRRPLVAPYAGLPKEGLRGGPAMPIRWVDEWDNADGSIERGYAGRSIFFDSGQVRDDLAPVAEYARLLASVGINGCNLNNVNNADVFLAPEMLQGVARIADTMRPYGIRVALSADIASPQKIGGLPTFDPLDPAVKKWWTEKVNHIYSLIPDFAGFTVKADSEGQAGPASYGRSPADAANMLAAALAPHDGVVLYRAFVYNHHLDWRDPRADRARAAYDIFHPLDGRFSDNVIVQIKEGPIDFQVREPVSPLFGALTQTNEALELQITQEYLGQQKHLVYIAPMWKEVLDSDMRVNRASTPVKQIISGKSFHRKYGGMIGVACVGQQGWLGSPLALANLYAFGRLAWDPNLKSEDIAAEWTRRTISADPAVVHVVTSMLMRSWPAYEDYTGPLGLQTLTDITGSHYGPNIEASERNGWGQWHKADHGGVGFDRTIATGTGFAGQYQPEVAKIYESAETTPDDLLLFFHHVPYTYKLHDEKTVIQYLYDSHYEGAAQAAEFVRDWESVKGKVDSALYADVLPRLEYQAGHAIVWRDAVVQYFLKLSGIPDARGRAGHYPDRLEAEDARLSGYKVIDVNPWEDASRGKAVSCEGQQSCSTEWTYQGSGGRFDIAVQYFDLQDGVAKFTLAISSKQSDSWTANGDFPSRRPNGDNSTRHIVHEVSLRPGDTLRIEGTPDGPDAATLDYIEIQPATPAALP
ncbi:MAG TPA: alpha-glucuronidase family glycosyl hydrolase [Terracidiphilus sp.]